jgi:hypothetical protein
LPSWPQYCRATPTEYSLNFHRPFDEHDLTHAMWIAEDTGGKNLRITLLGWVGSDLQ